MEQRCETCRWWDVEDKNTWIPEELRGSHGLCELAQSLGYKANDEYYPAHRESKSRALDAEHCCAHLMTAADFGCVQWEPKAALRE